MTLEPAIVGPRLSSAAAAFYEHLLRGLPCGAAVLHLPQAARESTWTLLAANSQAKRLVGNRVDDYLKLAAWNAEHPKPGRLPVGRTIRAALQTGRPKTVGYLSSGMKFRSADVFAVRAVPLGGSRVAVLFDDVTLRVMGTRAQARSESALEQICASARAILWTADPVTLQCRTVTPEARRLLGYWLERWQNEVNFLRNHTHPDDWESLRSACARAAHNETLQPFDLRMFDQRGNAHWFQMHLSSSRVVRARRIERRDGRNHRPQAQ